MKLVNNALLDIDSHLGSSGFAAGGDLTGTSTNQTVAKIRGVPTPTAAPSDGSILAYSASLGALIYASIVMPDVDLQHIMTAGREITSYASPPRVVGSCQYNAAGSIVFRGVLGVSIAGVRANVRVYDATHAAYLGTGPLTVTALVPTQVEATLTQVAPSTLTTYETHLWYDYVTSGPIGAIDYSFCDFAGIKAA
jgi:hypothetical protein